MAEIHMHGLSDGLVWSGLGWTRRQAMGDGIQEPICGNCGNPLFTDPRSTVGVHVCYPPLTAGHHDVVNYSFVKTTCPACGHSFQVINVRSQNRITELESRLDEELLRVKALQQRIRELEEEASDGIR